MDSNTEDDDDDYRFGPNSKLDFTDKLPRECRLYIGNLANDVIWEDVAELFRPFGHIRRLWVSQRTPGFGFVFFDNVGDARNARNELHNIMFHGKTLTVALAKVKCYACGKRGHTGKYCVEPQQEPGAALQSSSSSTSSNSSTSSSSSVSSANSSPVRSHASRSKILCWQLPRVTKGRSSSQSYERGEHDYYTYYQRAGSASQSISGRSKTGSRGAKSRSAAKNGSASQSISGRSKPGSRGAKSRSVTKSSSIPKNSQNINSIPVRSTPQNRSRPQSRTLCCQRVRAQPTNGRYNSQSYEHGEHHFDTAYQRAGLSLTYDMQRLFDQGYYEGQRHCMQQRDFIDVYMQQHAMMTRWITEVHNHMHYGNPFHLFNSAVYNKPSNCCRRRCNCPCHLSNCCSSGNNTTSLQPPFFCNYGSSLHHQAQPRKSHTSSSSCSSTSSSSCSSTSSSSCSSTSSSSCSSTSSSYSSLSSSKLKKKEQHVSSEEEIELIDSTQVLDRARPVIKLDQRINLEDDVTRMHLMAEMFGENKTEILNFEKEMASKFHDMYEEEERCTVYPVVQLR